MAATRWIRGEISAACILLTAAHLAGCGSGDDTPPPPAPTLLNGVAATGAPMAGASMTVIDGDATTPDPAAVTAGADGSYSVDVSALKPPLLVRASAVIEGVATETVAAVPALTANASNVANVTPLTHAVAALVAPGGDPLALTASTLAASVTGSKVADATALLVNTLTTDAGIAGALGASFNPLTTPFNADGSGIDAVLDALAISVTSGGVSITNLSAPVADTGVPAPITLTAPMIGTPGVVPTLPPSAPAGSLPTAAELAALGARFEACLALPVAQRVTLDANGDVTGVLAPCDYAAADWRSNGRTWAQDVGQFTFAKTQLSGAKVGKATIVLNLAAAGLTDPKEIKHPYCNSATCVVVRYPMTSASGQATSGDWVLAKVGGAWNFVGNQRPYRTFIEPRLNRKIATNTGGAGAGSTVDPYFLTDRYESVLRLIFDLSVGDTSDVRAVRMSGPGLPAGGMVLFRSQRCGTDDRMGISYQSGSTRVITNTSSFQFWTGSSSADYVLDAARLDGTPLTMPTPVLNSTTASFQDFSPAPVANQAAAIPAWALYKAEIFRYSNLSDTPDEILYNRINSAAENAAEGVSKPWPTLAPAFITDHLTPTGAAAGSIASFAQTLNWTVLPGTYVGSAYLFSQNFASATNSQGETATHGLRTRIDFEPAALGDAVATGYRFASVVAGTSLSPSTVNSGSNPNPRCTSQTLVPLTTHPSDYREAGLSFRGTDRKLYNAIWFWDN